MNEPRIFELIEGKLIYAETGADLTIPFQYRLEALQALRPNAQFFVIDELIRG